MNWIDVISAGPGAAELLTAQAKAAIENAEAVFCAQRNADLVSPDKRRPLTIPPCWCPETRGCTACWACSPGALAGNGCG